VLLNLARLGFWHSLWAACSISIWPINREVAASGQGEREGHMSACTPRPIDAYVTGEGGVVILNGPFPAEKARQIAILCNAAPDLLDALRAAMFFVPEDTLARSAGDAAIAKAEGRLS